MGESSQYRAVHKGLEGVRQHGPRRAVVEVTEIIVRHVTRTLPLVVPGTVRRDLVNEPCPCGRFVCCWACCFHILHITDVGIDRGAFGMRGYRRAIPRQYRGSWGLSLLRRVRLGVRSL